jgi:hypothetical protein
MARLLARTVRPTCAKTQLPVPEQPPVVLRRHEVSRQPCMRHTLATHACHGRVRSATALVGACAHSLWHAYSLTPLACAYASITGTSTSPALHSSSSPTRSGGSSVCVGESSTVPSSAPPAVGPRLQLPCLQALSSNRPLPSSRPPNNSPLLPKSLLPSSPRPSSPLPSSPLPNSCLLPSSPHPSSPQSSSLPPSSSPLPNSHRLMPVTLCLKRRHLPSNSHSMVSLLSTALGPLPNQLASSSCLLALLQAWMPCWRLSRCPLLQSALLSAVPPPSQITRHPPLDPAPPLFGLQLPRRLSKARRSSSSPPLPGRPASSARGRHGAALPPLPGRPPLHPSSSPAGASGSSSPRAVTQLPQVARLHMHARGPDQMLLGPHCARLEAGDGASCC